MGPEVGGLAPDPHRTGQMSATMIPRNPFMPGPDPGQPGQPLGPPARPEPEPAQQPPTRTPQEVPSQPGKQPDPTREHPSDPKPAQPMGEHLVH